MKVEFKEILNQEILSQKGFIQDIQKGLTEKGYFIAKDLINKDFYKRVKLDSLKHVDKLEKYKSKLPEPLRGDLRAGIRDLSGYCKNNYWHLYRTCFFPWNRIKNENKTMIELSRRLSKLRNKVIGVDENYGTLIEENGDIAYTSLSYYPPCNGFLKGHSDSTYGKPIVHFKVELTHKGVDYFKGGFFIVDKKGLLIDISAKVKPTDVIFFEGNCIHGINPISNSNLGRVALFEIPTSVNSSSRMNLYSNDGWNIVSRMIYKISNKFDKQNKILTPIIIKLTQKIFSFLQF